MDVPTDFTKAGQEWTESDLNKKISIILISSVAPLLAAGISGILIVHWLDRMYGTQTPVPFRKLFLTKLAPLGAIVVLIALLNWKFKFLAPKEPLNEEKM